MCADCSLSGRKHLFAVSEFETLENLKFIFCLSVQLPGSLKFYLLMLMFIEITSNHVYWSIGRGAVLAVALFVPFYITPLQQFITVVFLISRRITGLTK